jgi:hypothetical protein
MKTMKQKPVEGRQHQSIETTTTTTTTEHTEGRHVKATNNSMNKMKVGKQYYSSVLLYPTISNYTRPELSSNFFHPNFLYCIAYW